MALPIAKSWIQLRTNTVHYHFVFSSPGSCFKSAICIQLESAPISDHLVRMAKLFTRKIWGLRWPWSSIKRPPKHQLMFFPSMLSAKEVILRSRNEVCRFSQQRNMFTRRSTLIGHNYHKLSTCWTDWLKTSRIVLSRSTLHYNLLCTFERFWDFFRIYISSRSSIICRLIRLSGLPEGLTRWQLISNNPVRGRAKL